MFTKIMDFWMSLLGVKAPSAPQVESTPEPAPVVVAETPAKPTVDVTEMTKKELVDYAASLGVELKMNMKKADMIAALAH